MAKNKQKNGQPMGPKMARALKVRCDALEDCVVSQQAKIAELESEVVNMRLGYDLMKRRHDDALRYLELNRPEILQLMKVSAKHGVLAAAGKLPSVTVKLVKRKLKAPKIPGSVVESDPLGPLGTVGPSTVATQAHLDFVKALMSTASSQPTPQPIPPGTPIPEGPLPTLPEGAKAPEGHDAVPFKTRFPMSRLQGDKS